MRRTKAHPALWINGNEKVVLKSKGSYTEFVPKVPNDLRKVPIGKRTWDTSKIGKLPTSNPYGMGLLGEVNPIEVH